MSPSVTRHLGCQAVRIGGQYDHPTYDDSYDPTSAAAQLGISESFFRESVKNDPKAPVIVGRGMIACNTPALQEWWDSKKHHRVSLVGCPDLTLDF